MTVEPVLAENILIAAMAGAMVIMFGAFYSLVFAWSRTHDRPRLMGWAYVAYAALVGATLVLARALHLEGFWQGVIGVMLVGYLIAPHAIWHLCVGTHGHEHGDLSKTHDNSLRGRAGGG